jgi:hypothetical protein
MFAGVGERTREEMTSITRWFDSGVVNLEKLRRVQGRHGLRSDE